MSVAEQLGLPEGIMKDARSLLEPQHLRFEDWLNELQGERQQLKERLEAADRAQAGAEATRRDLDAQLQDLEERREEILHSVRRELAAQYDEVRKKLRRAEAALSWSAPPVAVPTVDAVTKEVVQEVDRDIESARSELQELERRALKQRREIEQRPLAVGDLVDVRGLNVQGTVQTLPDQGDEAEVLVGSVRLRIDVHRLSHAREPEETELEAPAVGYDLGPVMATLELDLRGMRAEEALIEVEEFLDKALRDGLSSVRIIHGKGTGVLRQAVRELLEHHPLARSFRSETPDRGGSGATAVELT